MTRSIIGITVDNRNNSASSGTYECASAYCNAVDKAGGVPVLLPHQLDRVDDYLALCHGFILTGGVDPDTESFGEAMHANARPMDPLRQTFELTLIRRLRSLPEKSLLGVCLGMQLMTLDAGGRLNQFLPDTHASHEIHKGNQRHAINLLASDSKLCGNADLQANQNATEGDSQTVVSSHQQAMETSGDLRVVAQSPDGVIEAVDDPSRSFYVGVQWHPERGGDGMLNQGLIDRLVAACRETQAVAS